MSAWVDYFSGGVKKTVELTDEPVVLGRQRDCALVLGSEPVRAPERGQRRPNILFLFADDLGYGDLGWIG